MPAPHRKAKPTLPDRREKDVRHLRSGCAPSLPGMAYIFARDVRHLHPGQSGTSPAAFSRRKKRIRQKKKVTLHRISYFRIIIKDTSVHNGNILQQNGGGSTVDPHHVIRAKSPCSRHCPARQHTERRLHI